MNKFVWSNRYLPQTLYISVILAYFRAGAAVLFVGIQGLLDPISILYLGAIVLGAFGIANVRWWGYILSLIMAFLPFILGIYLTLANGNSLISYFGALLAFDNMVSTIFDIALIALLIHPMSTKYVKANFEKSIP